MRTEFLSLLILLFAHCSTLVAADVLQRPQQPIPVTPNPTNDLPVFKAADRLIMDYMGKQDCVGLTAAVTLSGRLVYARGFGYADLGSATPALPTSLFRIASISKPITAVATLQLMQRRQFNFDSQVTKLLDLEPLLDEGKTMDERMSKVTIRHLLHHDGGWDRDASFPPMASPTREKVCDILKIDKSELHPRDIVRYMFGQPLDFDPGSKHAYSNFGYCVLGRVIEQASGQPYEAYVQKNVLNPIGIRSMRVGATESSENEVRYHKRVAGAKGEFVYATDKLAPRIYDSHGGWIASAVELARFGCAFDNPRACRILSANAIQAMHSRPIAPLPFSTPENPKSMYYACGWKVYPKTNGIATSHSGGLEGTSAILTRRVDGMNFVVLMNSEKFVDNQSVSPVMGKVADALRNANLPPRFDLFRTIYKPPRGK